MKVARSFNISIGLILCVAAVDVSASTYTGTISDVIVQQSPITANNIRVSIKIQNASVSNCTGLGGIWYSYDLPEGILAKSWNAILLSTLTTGRNVLIGGTGQCDAYNIETVSYIQAK